MRLEDIRYFLQVAESGSINRTAKNNYITQQGLSRIIANMEKELDVRLFEREGKTLKLTATGQIVANGLREVEKAYNSMLDRINQMSDRFETEQTYTIYATSVICITCLPHILNEISRRFPFVRFCVVEKNILEILEEIDFDGSCIGIVSGPAFLQEQSGRLRDGRVCFEKMFSDALRCAVHEGNPVANRSIVTMCELSRLSLVCHYTEILMAEHMLKERFNPALITNTTNHSLCRSIVSQGFSVGMTSAIIEHYVGGNDAIVTIPFENSVCLDYGCVYDKPENLGGIGRVIRGIVKRELQSVPPL